ncbi:MAG: hypothetical protein JO227_10350, partial [Acetobacteraceae bacterium]|nr:hypothetical protein [Acetobacteraceae bacterium]
MAKALRPLRHDPTEVPVGYDPEIFWDGLGLLPFAIAVHYKSDHPEADSAAQEVAFCQKNDIPYRTLRDGEALIVDGDRQRITEIRAWGTPRNVSPSSDRT